MKVTNSKNYCLFLFLSIVSILTIVSLHPFAREDEPKFTSIEQVDLTSKAVKGKSKESTGMVSPAVKNTPGDLADHVVISEIYYNSGNDSASEFIEFYNPTASAIDLSGWSFTDDGGSSWVNFGNGTDSQNNLTIPSHGFLLLADGGWSGGKDNSAWPSADVIDEIGLTNGGDTVKIRDAKDNVVDSVTYVGDANNKQGVERKANSSSTASSMRGAGADANLGNGYDTDSFSADFVGPLSGGPQNTNSSVETYGTSGGTTGNQPPVADPGGPYDCNVGEKIQLDGSGSSDPDGTIASYEWELTGDDSYDDATGQAPNFTCESSGSKSIKLRVTDDKGATDSKSTTVTVGKNSTGTVSKEIQITEPGWHMVGIPLSPSSNSPTDTFPGLKPSVINHWNPGKNGNSGGYVTPADGYKLKPYQGNWVHLKDSQVPKTFTVKGKPVEQGEIVLAEPGWHQIVIPGTAPLSALGVRQTKSGKVVGMDRAIDELELLSRFVWEWASSKKAYYAYEIGNNKKSFGHKVSYWVLTNKPGVRLVFPFTAPPQPPASFGRGTSSGILLTPSEIRDEKIPTPPYPPELDIKDKFNVYAIPNPVKGERQVLFKVSGEEIVSINVCLYNSAGNMIFDSGLRSENSYKWDLENEKGAKITNGLFLYEIIAQEDNGKSFVKSGKLVVLR